MSKSKAVSWAELHGEEDLYGTSSQWIDEAKEAQETNVGRIWCKVCNDYIYLHEQVLVGKYVECPDGHRLGQAR
jgi:hypothetical protein